MPHRRLGRSNETEDGKWQCKTAGAAQVSWEAEHAGGGQSDSAPLWAGAERSQGLPDTKQQGLQHNAQSRQQRAARGLLAWKAAWWLGRGDGQGRQHWGGWATWGLGSALSQWGMQVVPPFQCSGGLGDRCSAFCAKGLGLAHQYKTGHSSACPRPHPSHVPWPWCGGVVALRRGLWPFLYV